MSFLCYFVFLRFVQSQLYLPISQIIPKIYSKLTLILNFQFENPREDFVSIKLAFWKQTLRNYHIFVLAEMLFYFLFSLEISLKIILKNVFGIFVSKLPIMKQFFETEFSQNKKVRRTFYYLPISSISFHFVLFVFRSSSKSFETVLFSSFLSKQWYESNNTFLLKEKMGYKQLFLFLCYLSVEIPLIIYWSKQFIIFIILNCLL